MLPVLLDLKFVKIYTFGVFLVLAFFWASFVFWKNIHLTSYKEDEMFDGLFVVTGASLFFGRLVYVILNFKAFGFDILKFILINGYPGLSLYGCVLGGFISLYLFLRSKKIPWKAMVDYVIGPVFLALAFGKLGAFLSGVEVGTKTKMLLSVKYIGFDGFRHLTSLYESLLFVFGFYLAQKMVFEIRKEKYPQGFAFSLFLWYFALVYFVFDNLKVNHLYFLGVSFNKNASVVFLLTFTIYFLYYFRILILEKLGAFTNFFKLYGQKTIKTIHRAAKKKDGGRQEENPSSYRGA